MPRKSSGVMSFRYDGIEGLLDLLIRRYGLAEGDYAGAIVQAVRNEFARLWPPPTGEIYIDVRDCRARIARAGVLATNWCELEEQAINAIEAFGGYITLSGIYPCPDELAARADWSRPGKYEQDREATMSDAELFELFSVATCVEITALGLETVTQQVGELRAEWRNEPAAERLADLTDEQIAERILNYARSE